MRLVDLTGRRFGRLVVMERAGSARNGTGMTPTWLVRCDCGSSKIVLGPNLRKGATRSCGCALRPHGMFGTPEYKAWTSMIQRCVNPRCRSFRLYGARGIQVCPAWRLSFQAFLADMGRRPGPNYSLDRRDSDGNYEPRNCRWATREQQGRNKRNNHVLEVGDLGGTLSEWAERTGVGKTTIRERLRRGWSASRAVMTPSGS